MWLWQGATGTMRSGLGSEGGWLVQVPPLIPSRTQAGWPRIAEAAATRLHSAMCGSGHPRRQAGRRKKDTAWLPCSGRAPWHVRGASLSGRDEMGNQLGRPFSTRLWQRSGSARLR
ncbi:hypothetical protein DPEC_G00379550 [Dallia pectoralis]|nr:hypothetical protein DPEC_G00379550 [Dallia pectoralis]